jgi:uncharacterized membrane protein
MTLTRRDWLIPAGLITLGLVPALAGVVRVAELARGAAVTPENARFVAAPLPVLIHIPAVILYSILGAFQFSPGLRRQRRGWHRAAGRVLVPAGIVVALSGLWMARFYPWPPGDGLIVYAERLVVGTAMLASIAVSLDAIRRRDFAAHGDWMTRAYAIGLGAGTQVFTHLPWLLLAPGKPGELARGIMMGAGWLINVVAAEWIIRRRSTRARPSAASDGRGRHRVADARTVTP